MRDQVLMIVTRMILRTGKIMKGCAFKKEILDEVSWEAWEDAHLQPTR